MARATVARREGDTMKRNVLIVLCFVVAFVCATLFACASHKQTSKSEDDITMLELKTSLDLSSTKIY